MDDVEYAIFEPAPVPPAPTRTRGSSRPQFRGPMLTANRLLQPGPPPTASALSLKMSRDPDQAEKARSEGKVVLRVPKMPVRLIPQFDRQGPPPPGSPWGVAAVEADRLPPGSQGEGVTVAVLDTGIDAAHPTFQGLINKNNYKDFTGNGLADNVGHGTHCAGIIFGRSVGGTRIGVAPGITQVLVGKIADKDFVTTTTELRQALVWAVDNGAQVISLSVGLDFLGHKKALEGRGLSDRVAMAQALNDYRDYTRFFDGLMRLVVAPGTAAKSALLVAACGNDSVPEDSMRVQATLPAVAEHVIAVSALDEELAVAPFCNALADLCGPGVGILSAAPGGGLATMSGTSQAAPHVAAVAALWWQKLATDRGEPPAPDAVRNELLGAARRDRIAGDADITNIGRGIALAPPPPSQ